MDVGFNFHFLAVTQLNPNKSAFLIWVAVFSQKIASRFLHEIAIPLSPNRCSVFGSRSGNVRKSGQPNQGIPTACGSIRRSDCLARSGLVLGGQLYSSLQCVVGGLGCCHVILLNGALHLLQCLADRAGLRPKNLLPRCL